MQVQALLPGVGPVLGEGDDIAAGARRLVVLATARAVSRRAWCALTTIVMPIV